MKKLKTLTTITSLVTLLSGSSCFRNTRNPSCRTWDLEHKRRLETCVLYNNSGKPIETRYTLYSGWNLPVVTTYDKGLDGPDGTIKYEYNIHRKVKRQKGDFNGNQDRVEEIIYDKEGKIVLVRIDEDGDGKVDKVIARK
jgi:hypothetical protein